VGRKKVKKNKITTFPEEFDELEQLLEGCESGDWKVRLESMTRISELCGHYP
jgi:integrase